MLINYRSVTGLTIEATDGPIGKIEQFYFDDQNWAIRYCVVDIGSLLHGKKVLLSPAVFDRIKDHYGFSVKATKDQVRHSPDFDSAKPVSRQHEIELHDYYAWPYYWAYPFYFNSLGSSIYPGLGSPEGLAPIEPSQTDKEAVLRDEKLREQRGETHLRSTKEVSGYTVMARDGETGRVHDFVFDIPDWVIRYIIIDTSTVFHQRKVLIAPQWTQGIDWEESRVYINFPKDIIRNGPEYESSLALTRDFEDRVYDYYKQQKYWL